MKKLFPSDPTDPCKMIIERWKNNRENSLPPKPRKKKTKAKQRVTARNMANKVNDWIEKLSRHGIRFGKYLATRFRAFANLSSPAPDHHFVREQRFVSSQFFELWEREMGLRSRLTAKLKFMYVVFIESRPPTFPATFREKRATRRGRRGE